MKRLMLGGAVGALALAFGGIAAATAQDGGASADMPGPGGRGGPMMLERMFTDADTDGNGEVSRAEAEAAAIARFARMDRNGDGRFDEADRAARKDAAEDRRERLFTRLDSDKDGVVTRAEADAAAAAAGGDAGGRRGTMLARLFERADTNRDGRLTEAEFAAAPAGRRGMGRRMGGGGGGMGEGVSAGMGGSGAMMRQADTNGDGVLTREESVAGALRLFDRIDRDGNGSISAAEREAAMTAFAAMRDRLQGRRGGRDGAEPGPPPPPPGADEDF
jgi:Ca2+-binding EF-hand superfamily protein